MASTSLQSVAYKYKAGLKGLTIAPASKVRWRDIANAWQEYRFGGATNDGPVPLRAANRLVVAEGADGALAALPPLGKKRFEIPFDATGKKWVRFAAWDTAGNGAMVQPVRLTSPATTTTTR